jgi:uncharacterized membrane protein YciS (DUF1049 family)
MKNKIWQNLHTLKFSYLFNNDQYKTCDLLKQLYTFLITSCKIFHLKKKLYEKVKKIVKKTHIPFVK